MAERMNMMEAGTVFTADDIQFQKAAANVEKTMAGVAAELSAKAKQINQALARSAAGFEPLSDEIQKTMRKASASLERDVRTINKALAETEPVAENTTSAIQKLTRAFVGREIVNQLGEGLRRMGNAAAEMSQKMRLGEATAGELALKIAEGIPVIGHFIEAGRGIRELITGEDALVEAIKRQNAEQVRRLEITKDLVSALRHLKREQEDIDSKLGKGFGPGSFGDRLADTFRAAGRSLEDSAAKATGDNTGVLARIRAELDAKGKELERLVNTRSTKVIGTGGIHGGGAISVPDTEGLALIKDAQTAMSQLRDQERQLLQAIDATRQKIVAEIGQDTAKATFGLFGQEAARGIRLAVTAIDELIPKLSPMSAATKTALESMRSDYDRLNDALKDYRDNLDRNAIKTEDFAKLSTAAIVKVVRPLDLIAAKIREAMSPLNTLGFNLKATFDRIVGGPVAKKPDEPRAFRASFVGLADMGRRIQEAAGGKDPATDIAAQQLKEQQKANGFAKIIADAQRQLIDALPKVGRLK